MRQMPAGGRFPDRRKLPSLSSPGRRFHGRFPAMIVGCWGGAGFCWPCYRCGIRHQWRAGHLTPAAAAGCLVCPLPPPLTALRTGLAAQDDPAALEEMGISCTGTAEQFLTNVRGEMQGFPARQMLQSPGDPGCVSVACMHPAYEVMTRLLRCQL